MLGLCTTGSWSAVGHSITSLASRAAPTHLDTLDSKHGLAVVYWSRRKFDPADALFQEVVQERTAKLGAAHRDTLTAKNNLAALYRSQRDYRRSEPLFRELVETRASRLGPDHPDTFNAKNNLATVWRARDATTRRAAAARSDPGSHGQAGRGSPGHPAQPQQPGCPLSGPEGVREAVQGSRDTLGLTHADTQQRLRDLILTLERMGQPARAEPLGRELVEFWRQHAGDESPQYLDQIELLALNLWAQRKAAEAEPLLRSALAIREKSAPDAWTTFHTRSLLGATLLALRNPVEGEPLLRQGYEGLMQRLSTMAVDDRARLHETGTRLARLLSASGRNPDAARWRRDWAGNPAPAESGTR